MRVCVLANDEGLGARISEAVTASGRECPSGQAVRIDQAERFLARDRPDVVVAATGPDPASALSTVARLRDLTSGHLLAVGPVSDPRLVLGVLRNGAVDYVDEMAVESELTSALERLASGRAGRVKPGRVYAILGASGGSGSSLLAANLAVSLSKTGERSLAIDLKPRLGDVAALMDMKPTHSLQDLCRVPSRIDRVLFEQTLAKHASGASLLASPRAFDVSYSEEAVERVFEVGRSMFSRVVADIDPALPEGTLDLMKSADAALVVMRLEFNSLRNAKSLLDLLERRGVDPKKILLVGNRVGQPKEIPAAKVEEALGRTFFAKLPDDPKPALASQNNGTPIVLEYASSRLSKAINALAASLNKMAASPEGGA